MIRKLNAKTYFKETQEKLSYYEGMDLAKYDVVDVNDYSEKELLEEESFLTKAMLIEKAKYTEKMVDYLLNIIEEINRKKEIYTKEQKELLKAIVNLILKKKLTEKDIQQMNRKLKEGSDENMLAVLDMIEEENRKIFAQGEKRGIECGLKRGIKRGILETAKKMLAKGIDIETIIEITGLTQEEILDNSK